MSTQRRARAQRARAGALVVGVAIGGIAAAGFAAALLGLLLSIFSEQTGCSSSGGSGPAGSIVLGPPGTGRIVGATEYGGPGDPSSGTTGARGDNLLAHPDSYAELGGLTWQTALAMGGLAYMAPLRITWASRSVIAYKRDFGLGGGPVAGFPRVIDLWWQLAERLGIPYSGGQWSGPVRIERPPAAGAGSLVGPAQPPTASLVTGAQSAQDPAACASMTAGGVSLVPGPRAQLLSDGRAAAPQDSPPAVQQMIAAGNQIVGRPYVYGAGHGLALSALAPAYDCSSSVEHLLYGARLVAATYAAASSELESFGQPGPGRWVTLYANADHVFMYVAGLRWDTHDAAGAGDGSPGIGWHPLVRSSAGFVARHPVGL